MAREDEVNLIFDMNKYTFGMEFEMKFVQRKLVAELVRQFFRVPLRSVKRDYHYDSYWITDNLGRRWRVMSDGSLHDGSKGCELVTPILTYSYDNKDLLDLIDFVKENSSALTDDECGIHIHIGANDFSTRQIINIQKLWYNYEDLIFKALKVLDSRIKFCKKSDEEFIKKLKDVKHSWFLSRESMKNLWYEDCEDSPESKYNSTRYHSLNFHSLFTKGTVEFRLFNGTLERDLIQSYIQFILAFIRYATLLKKPRFTKIIRENEKYVMRSFLRNMKLNGETFKICRKVFLENLSGDLVNSRLKID